MRNFELTFFLVVIEYVYLQVEGCDFGFSVIALNRPFAGVEQMQKTTDTAKNEHFQ